MQLTFATSAFTDHKIYVLWFGVHNHLYNKDVYIILSEPLSIYGYLDADCLLQQYLGFNHISSILFFLFSQLSRLFLQITL